MHIGFISDCTVYECNIIDLTGGQISNTDYGAVLQSRNSEEERRLELES